MKRNAQLFLGATTVVVIYGMYTILSAIHIAHTTGTLEVSSSNPKAGIVVTQTNTQPEAVGIGHARIRLRPGTYRISATVGTYETVKTVQVYARQATISKLQLTTTTNTPASSLYGINITNTSELNSLLPSSQYTYVLQTTGNYIINHIDANAQTAAISATTVEQDGSINFTVHIDTQPSKNLHILLQPQAGSRVFMFSVVGTSYSTVLNPYQ